MNPRLAAGGFSNLALGIMERGMYHHRGDTPPAIPATRPFTGPGGTVTPRIDLSTGFPVEQGAWLSIAAEWRGVARNRHQLAIFVSGRYHLRQVEPTGVFKV